MFRTVLTAFAVAAASLISVGAALAQGAIPEQREFCADRPGKGAATCVLDQGVVQVESGLVDFASHRDAAFKIESWAVASTLIRYGLTPLLEVQVGLTPWQTESVTDRQTGDQDSVEGVGDLFLSARRALGNPDGSGRSAAIQGYLTLPTGSDAVRADGIEGGLVLPFGLPIDHNWSLALTPGIDIVRDADGEGSHVAWGMVAGLGRDVGDWNLGAEVWVSRDEDPLDEVTQSTFDLTAVWSPPFMANAQIDFGLNFGLNDQSPDLEFGVGVARRF
ncbi:hypothetical protein GCM10009116_18670 [Brevundimonas basaltis]|uniref:Transporter n=1 Tax=Brevundimonas basaltis TaxID=472166 RepID=A0A7W8HW00_9CAUL|nr:transporter [Brevundimonas basaltis]MBB5290825.1 hypothetical protein [Brevundimonas basaltis]